MTDVVEEQANLSQLATQWDYRAVAAQDAAQIYSRNVGQQKLPVSNSAQTSSQVDKRQGYSKIDPPVLSGNTRHCDVEIAESEFDGLTPIGWATKLLGDRKKAVLWKRDKEIRAYHPRRE